MMNFSCDYLEGVHQSILERMMQTNMEQLSGYGEDIYCISARDKIKDKCENQDAEVHFISGGTQTNATVIKAILRPYEGVIAADTGHISTHEAGAIEATGHKVLTLPNVMGKITPEDLRQYVQTFFEDQNHRHMVKPGMVYISHPTEYGTLYTRKELEDIRSICDIYKLPLFLDGARLGYGLVADGTDVDLPLIAKCCDVFYIGGTKVGAMFGEAVVVTAPSLFSNFFTLIKQQGALLAKGRFLGIQFDTLFSGDLYWKIAGNAILRANQLKEGLMEKGYRFYLDSPTNQQFIIIENEKLESLSDKVVYSYWEPYGPDHTVIRFATSWATTEKDVLELIEMM